MLASKTTEIDGLKFTTTEYPARRQSRLLNRLVRILGPAAGVLGKVIVARSGGDSNKVLEELMNADLGPLLHSIFSRLDDAEHDALLSETLAGTSVIFNEKNVSLSTDSAIDLVFTGKLMTMYRVVGHALKVNFSDFSEAVKSLTPRGDVRQAAE